MYSWRNIAIGIVSAVVILSALSWAFTPGATPAQQVAEQAREAVYATMGWGERFINWMSDGTIVSTRQMVRDTSDMLYTAIIGGGIALLFLGSYTVNGLNKKVTKPEVEAKNILRWAKIPGSAKFDAMYDRLFGNVKTRGIRTEQQAIGAMGINAYEVVRSEEVLELAHSLALRNGATSAAERIRHRISLMKSGAEEFGAKCMERVGAAGNTEEAPKGPLHGIRNTILRRNKATETGLAQPVGESEAAAPVGGGDPLQA